MSYAQRYNNEQEFLRTALTEEQKALYVSDANFHYNVNAVMKVHLDARERLPQVIQKYQEEALTQRAAHIEAERMSNPYLLPSTRKF